jgi:signal peptidase II
MRSSRHLIRTISIVLLVLTNISCDQISKNLVRQNIQYYENINFLGNHVTLTKIENSGAFLSLGDSFSSPLKFILLSILPTISLTLGFLFMVTKKDLTKITLLALCLIIGGGIGNVYDRLVYGSVTDFLHIDFGFFQTGIFNLADVSIMIGMFIILIHAYFKRAELNQL